MAPHGESLSSSFSRSNNISKLSSENLQRTVSDISFELAKEGINDLKLPPISEVEDAKCECCGMSEECTPEFNKYGRAFPVLFQAEAMKEMLKKNKLDGRMRAKSISPRDKGGQKKGAGIARSSSCIPAITREMNDIKITN
ncbi:hypothetical protein SESBI_38843 [Sesbania bispinosa]|nr:hypothetical protein SESBI_38843 [Sesbania bispinosa]